MFAERATISFSFSLELINPVPLAGASFFQVPFQLFRVKFSTSIASTLSFYVRSLEETRDLYCQLCRAVFPRRERAANCKVCACV